MDEFIDIVTKQGKPTGRTALKSVVHKKGYYHNTVHIWFYTNEGEILLQQRAKTKTIYPLLWDVSVAGHVDSGETLKQAAKRETKEEIGLKIKKKQLQKIGVFKSFQTYENGIIDNEFHHTFIYEFNVPVSKLTPQKSEVETLKLVSMFDFFDKLEHSKTNNHFIAKNEAYYNFVAEAILQKIT